MDKVALLENSLTVRLLSGQTAEFLTELKQMDMTPSEARTSNPFGDPKIGEMVATVLDKVDDSEAVMGALSSLRDYLQKSADVTTKVEPAKKDESDVKIDSAEIKLTKDQDDVKVEPADMETEPTVPASKLETGATQFSVNDIVDSIKDLSEGISKVNDSITEMQKLLSEFKPGRIDTNFSGNEGENMDKVCDEKTLVLDTLKDLIAKLEKPAEEPEAEEPKKDEEFCGDKNFAEDPDKHEDEEPPEEPKADEVKEDESDHADKPEEPKAEEPKKDEVGELVTELKSLLVDLKSQLAEQKQEKVEEAKAEPAPVQKDEGLTKEEVSLIEGEDKAFSTENEIDTMRYLFGG